MEIGEGISMPRLVVEIELQTISIKKIIIRKEIT